MTQLLIFFLLTIFSYIGVYLIRRYTEDRQILDHPNERSLHITATPLGGGLAIVFIVIGTSLWLINAWVELGRNQVGLNRTLVYVICGIILAWLGWRDDVKPLSARVRFTVQGLVAVVSIYSLGYFNAVTIPLFGELQLGVVGILITFLWIVGLINAYNFMDGIDGMAGGVAFAGALGWMMLSLNTHNMFVFWIALAIAASNLGFLFHNWSPAKIFMGDVASTFLGYTFAIFPLISSNQDGDTLMLGTLLMWAFIMDAGITFIRRLLKRENVFAPHRTHLYQKLIIAGYKHSTVSLLYIFLTLFASILSYAWSSGHAYAPPLIILGLPLIWIFLSRYVSKLGSAVKQ